MSFHPIEQATSHLNRSELSVPRSQAQLFEKAAQSDVDVIFLDLEDAFAPDQKEDARRIVDDTKALADRLHVAGNRPFGELRMSVPVVFAHGCLNRWLPDYLDRYPDVTLDIDVSERRADMIAEGIDLLVRIGDLPSSDLVSRETFQTRRMTLVAPDYLKRRGTPCQPAELRGHDLIGFSFHGSADKWVYPAKNASAVSVSVTPRLRRNDAKTEQGLALAGHGIVRMPGLACTAARRSGALVPILTAFEPAPAGVHVIYASKHNLPAKTRSIIDFLVEKSGGDMPAT